MKIHHYALIFILFFIVAVVKTDISIGNLKAVSNEKTELTESLDSASADAINYLAKTGTYGTNSINKDQVVKTFLTSLYSSMGIISDKSAQAEIELYIPEILICDTDGYYVYYYDEYKAADGTTYSERKWSEKMPYYYEDNYFIYRFSLTDTVSIYDKNHLFSNQPFVITADYHEIQSNDAYQDFRSNYSDCILLNDEVYELAKKSAIIKQLEDTMSYYTSRHNAIAEHNGITYKFSFPSSKDKDWARYMEDVNLIVVFQGYPYGIRKNYCFNKIASAGANISKKPVYYVEKKSWYYLAHKAGCSKLASCTTVLGEPFDSLEDCIKMGAYCDDCIENGARVPSIK